MLYIFWILHQTTTHRFCLLVGVPLYIFWILHQTTTVNYKDVMDDWLYIFWILHQTTTKLRRESLWSLLYIFWILHQTTTDGTHPYILGCCISFESYIKPQPLLRLAHRATRCISFESYIKPQLLCFSGFCLEVVYLLNPTSNHNLWPWTTKSVKVVYLLNPTSNHNVCRFPSFTPWLYIFWILHQTTTLASWQIHILSCISFESYIKPQRVMSSGGGHLVVYLLNPTSNHNCSGNRGDAGMVVYLLNPTSNHNSETSTLGCCIVVYLLNPTSNHNERKNASCILRLYIFWILHQTTTIKEEEYLQMSCISFESYIKPQPRRLRSWVVGVVYLLNPTSNHDPILILILFIMLYIFWILHQTTTRRRAGRISTGCISFESYIKPQLMCFFIQLTIVVYLLNPTSNHN